MAENLQKRSGTAVGNFNFTAKIVSHESDNPENPALYLPIDAVKGLGDGKTTVMRHRSNGSGWAVTTPYPGISTPDTATLEGSFLFDLADVALLQGWRDQVKGKLAFTGDGTIVGYFRDITIMPTSADNANVRHPSTPLELVGGTIKLVNCIATKLTISDFDINAPAICNWSLEVEYEDMEISPKVGA